MSEMSDVETVESLHELVIEAGAVVPHQLDEELRAALGAVYRGMSTYGPARPIVVRLSAEARADDEARVHAVIAAHDPAPEPPPKPLEARLDALEARVAALERQ